MRQGNLLDRIESRILIGLASYLGIMILIGWVAINENGRMESFERQYQARSIERGAALFAVNCSSCHGTQGLGVGGYAPALNNPQLFGYDILGEYEDAREAVFVEARNWAAEQTELTGEIVELETERGNLETQKAEFDPEADDYDEAVKNVDEQLEEIATRLEEITVRLDEINVLLTDAEEGVNARVNAINAEQNEILVQLQQETDYPFYTSLDESGAAVTRHHAYRLDQLNWNGTMYDFIFTTLVHGRPPSISYWGGNQMVAWSQQAGGPLRDDQLRDLTEYILNWDKGEDWTLDDFFAVSQYAIEPSLPGAGGAASAPVVGSDVAGILEQLATDGIVGDVARGEQLYLGTQATELGQMMACSGCHLGGINAPDTVGTWQRVIDARLTLPQFAGYTPEQYMVESIVRANSYIVEDFKAVVMPTDLGLKLSLQDLADMLAFLQTQ